MYFYVVIKVNSLIFIMVAVVVDVVVVGGVVSQKWCFNCSVRFVRHTVTNLTFLDKLIAEADDQKKMIESVQYLTK